jgi:membrane-bound lytic murein transglycosylase B
VNNITDERLREIVADEDDYAEAQSMAAELLAARAEVERLRADLREAIKLLQAHGQPPNWMMQTQFGATKEWNRSYGKLLAKHKETP